MNTALRSYLRQPESCVGLDGHHWNALSDLDHQMRDSAVHLVSTREQLLLQYATKSAIQEVDRAQLTGMKSGKKQTK
jgi:hypothetical protein